MKLVYSLLAIPFVILVACDKNNAEKDKAPAVNIEQAKAELEKKNIGNAIEIIIKVHKNDPNNSEAYYVESQADTLKGALDEATIALEKAITLGYKNFDEIKANKNLDVLRSTPQFTTLMNKYDETSNATISETEIEAGDVSIKVVGGKQVIKAGDVSVNLE